MTDSALSGPGVSLDPVDLIAQRARMLRHPLLDVPTSSLPGGFAVAKRGHGQVIADSRIYMQGDDMRHVDKGATARTGKLHVRTFHEERDRVTFLVADFRPSMLWGMRRAFRSVAAAEALAWHGWQAVEAGGRVGLLAITRDDRVLVATRARTDGMLAVIGGLVRAHERALAEASADLADQPLDAALNGLEKVVPRGAEMIIATSLDNKGLKLDAVLGRLARNRSPRFLFVEDRALEDLPAGYYPLIDPKGARVRANFGRTSTVEPAFEGLQAFPIDRIDAGAEIFDGPREGL